MNKNNYYNLFLLIILAFLIIFFLLSFIYKFEKKRELFDNSNSFGLYIETGTSNIEETGTIKFKKTFDKIPMIFTQINSNSNTSNYLFSINIFNITESGFNYSKNKAYNNNIITDEHSYFIPKIESSNLESFNWLAIS
jgi:hypothetical protein